MCNRIIVCGIYRSGTSLTTKLIRTWGAYAGKAEDIFEDVYGYLEHLSLQKFNDELLDNNSRIPTPEHALHAKADDPQIAMQARQILAAMDEEVQEAGLRAWVWKDPRIPLVFPFWSHFWKDAVFVIPVRHPMETIYSAAKMEGLEPENSPLAAGFIYWQYCMLNILKYTQHTQNKIFISYDQLLDSPQRECERLCTFLDEQCGIQAPKHDTRIGQMSAHIQEGKRHFQAPIDLANLEVVTAEQRALYNFLRVKTMNANEAYKPEDFALSPGWLEHLQLMDMVVSQMQGGE